MVTALIIGFWVVVLGLFLWLQIRTRKQAIRELKQLDSTTESHDDPLLWIWDGCGCDSCREFALKRHAD
jgi:hypothetical protein